MNKQKRKIMKTLYLIGAVFFCVQVSAAEGGAQIGSFDELRESVAHKNYGAIVFESLQGRAATKRALRNRVLFLLDQGKIEYEAIDGQGDTLQQIYSIDLHPLVHTEPITDTIQGTYSEDSVIVNTLYELRYNKHDPDLAQPRNFSVSVTMMPPYVTRIRAFVFPVTPLEMIDLVRQHRVYRQAQLADMQLPLFFENQDTQEED